LPKTFKATGTRGERERRLFKAHALEPDDPKQGIMQKHDRPSQRVDIPRDIGVKPMVEVIASTQRVEIVHDLFVIASLLRNFVWL
jgi:hypothetical protein